MEIDGIVEVYETKGRLAFRLRSGGKNVWFFFNSTISDPKLARDSTQALADELQKVVNKA